MRSIINVSIILGCLLAVVVARPQINWNDIFVQPQQPQQQRNPQNPFLPQRPGGNQNGGFLPTSTQAPVDGTSTPTVPTTASPRYLACMQSCPSTMEYNPVCGSDNLNYHNNARLRCAVFCGKEVAAVRMGTCRPL